MLQGFRLSHYPGLCFRRSPKHNPLTLAKLWQDGGRRQLLSCPKLLERAALLPGENGWYQCLYNDVEALVELIARLPKSPPPKLVAAPEETKRILSHRWPGIHFNDHQVYTLDRERLPTDPKPLSTLRAGDLGELLRRQPYVDEYGGASYLAHRIATGLSSCVRKDGRLVAWGLVQDDGSIGFLRVVESHRSRGLGAAVGIDLAARAVSAGLRPLAHVSTLNRASLALVERCGARPLGRVETWARYRSRAEIEAYERGAF